ncbi:T9SS type A sorting domain-containing protein [Hymenobacter sp. ASUV-10]|uniref:T9SS type A sorting domain-containing protein n=1 Tax=Hymenobacter aranciens TaxID=3063996 RepID=A0ABT9BB46_9BACT|nr:T9SS type A sorting domain-containing protein [Hymenobacter sp. ASUV-10]MDO7875417.1 T9SS type A sorting domain-containing protein [Hymenobacter sp. ASUV-10]
MNHFNTFWAGVRSLAMALCCKSTGLALALSGLLAPAVQAQAPAWQQALGLAPTTPAATQLRGMATDASGNVYVAGYFEGTLTLGNTTLTSVGGRDVLVAKWQPSTSTWLWAQRAGGTTDDYATALAVSGNNVYVTGQFDSITADFGATTLTNAGTSGTSGDVFVLKLTDSGSSTINWAQRAGGIFGDRAQAIAVSGTGVYITGVYSSSTADFGSTTLTWVNSPTGGGDIFVAKLVDSGSTGQFAWAISAGGDGNDRAYALAVQGSSIYIAGDYSGSTATFGGTQLLNVPPPPSDFSYNAFVSRLTEYGAGPAFDWATQLGGTGNEVGQALLWHNGSLYLAGSFTSSSMLVGSDILTNAGGSASPATADAFLARLVDRNVGGQFMWAQQLGGPGNEAALALAARADGIYVAGLFSSASIGSGNTLLTNTGPVSTREVWVARYRSAAASAQLEWARAAGGVADDQANALVLTGNLVVVGGTVTPAATFGPQAISASAGTLTGFVATLADPVLNATTAAAVGTLQLAPNPATGRTLLHLPPTLQAAGATLTLADGLGQVLRTTAVPGGAAAYPLDLSGLTPGLYLVRLSNGGTQLTRRLVVE